MICPACQGEGWLETGAGPWEPCPDCDGCGIAYCCEGADTVSDTTSDPRSDRARDTTSDRVRER